ncbi:MAG: hypothetical protein H0T42_07840 [Deltaproteobacteria bacterium]|nr:hypothetical protein [Deltaproteobacteria bacterium]
MKLVEPLHRSPSSPDDAFEELASFAASIGADDVALGARAVREQLWCSQLFVMVLGEPGARLRFLNQLISAAPLPRTLVKLESVPVVVRHGRSARARIHAAGLIHDVALDHSADLPFEVDAVELVVPSTALEHGLCVVNSCRGSAVVRGLVPRVDLALIVTDDATSTARELQRARELGFESGNIVFIAAASCGRAFARAQHIVFGDTCLGWHLLRAFLRRRADQSRSNEYARDLEVRRVLARLRFLLVERQHALEPSSTEARVNTRRWSATMARAVLGPRRSRMVDPGDLVQQLETERTKFLMAVKADLLAELATLVDVMDEPSPLLIPCSTALAQELSAAAVFEWSERLAPLIHHGLVRTFEHDIQRLWRELDIATETVLAAVTLLVEPRAFVGRPRVGRVPPLHIHGQVGDWLRGRSRMQRRASTVAAELLLTSLETRSRSLVENYIRSVDHSQRGFEAAFADTLEWMADTSATIANYAAAVRAGGASSLEAALYQNEAQRARLEELAELLAP